MRPGRETAGLAFLGLALASGCSTSVLQRMEAQEKFLPYSANPFFDDGRSMRPAIEGTVPREHLPGRPHPMSLALLAAGHRRFDITCATCHGLVGDGDSVVAQKMALRPPPSLHGFAGRPDEFFYKVIAEGYGMMPPYAAEISPEERWAVVAYVRALILSQDAPLEAAPPDVRASLEGRRP
jgi:cytochrome c5